MLKLFRIIQLPTLLLLIALCNSLNLAQQKPELPVNDRIRLAEAFRIGDVLGNRIWADGTSSFCVLLVRRPMEFLIRHPKPSAIRTPQS